MLAQKLIGSLRRGFQSFSPGTRFHCTIGVKIGDNQMQDLIDSLTESQTKIQNLLVRL